MDCTPNFTIATKTVVAEVVAAMKITMVAEIAAIARIAATARTVEEDGITMVAADETAEEVPTARIGHAEEGEEGLEERQGMEELIIGRVASAKAVVKIVAEVVVVESFGETEAIIAILDARSLRCHMETSVKVS